MITKSLKLLAVGAAVFSAQNAVADPIPVGVPPSYNLDAEISVYMGGLEILKFDWQTNQLNGRYDSTSHVYPVGVVAMLFDIDVKSSASGHAGMERVYPHYFASDYLEDGETVRSLRIDFDRDGPVDLTRVGGDQSVPKDEILALAGGMIDPLSAAMFNQTFINDGKFCNGTTTGIFSGDSAYSLSFKYVETTDLKKTRYSDYEGPAIICEVAGEPIAAFDEEARERMEARSPDEKPSRLYIGSIPAPNGEGEILVPVKVFVPTSFGTVVAHLTQFQVTEPQTQQLAKN